MLETILKNYQSIFGALIGVVVTLVTTYVLRHLGRIKIDILRFYQQKHNGRARVYLHTNFFNNAEIPKVLKDIKLIVKNSNIKRNHKLEPENKDPIYLPPNNYVDVALNFYMDKDEYLEKINRFDSIFKLRAKKIGKGFIIRRLKKVKRDSFQQ